MASGKRDYEAALIAVNKHEGAIKVRNVLSALQITTEDDRLKELLASVVDRLDETFTGRYEGEGVDRPLIKTKPEVLDLAPLVEYCETCIATTAPQWRLLAERQSWRPPEP